MRLALTLLAIAATLGSLIAAWQTRATWALLSFVFFAGAIAILGKLAPPPESRHARRIRKLGPLPDDPGLKQPPDLSRDPFRE